jgi:hypothetical protein
MLPIIVAAPSPESPIKPDFRLTTADGFPKKSDALWPLIKQGSTPIFA